MLTLPEKCAVMGCQVKMDCSKGICFYKFPKNPAIRKKWSQACGRRTNFNVDKSYICSEHFLPVDLRYPEKESKGKCPIVKTNAIPTLHLPKDYKQCAIEGCMTRLSCANGVCFYRFPADENLRREWVKACKRKLSEADRLYICSNHFEPQDLNFPAPTSKRKCPIVKKNAVPRRRLSLLDASLDPKTAAAQIPAITIPAGPGGTLPVLPGNIILLPPSTGNQQTNILLQNAPAPANNQPFRFITKEASASLMNNTNKIGNPQSKVIIPPLAANRGTKSAGSHKRILPKPGPSGSTSPHKAVISGKNSVEEINKSVPYLLFNNRLMLNPCYEGDLPNQNDNSDNDFNSKFEILNEDEIKTEPEDCVDLHEEDPDDPSEAISMFVDPTIIKNEQTNQIHIYEKNNLSNLKEEKNDVFDVND